VTLDDGLTFTLDSITITCVYLNNQVLLSGKRNLPGVDEKGAFWPAYKIQTIEVFGLETLSTDLKFSYYTATDHESKPQI